ncbi:MAG: DUF4251 domain-containing protein [Cruoricaptor ignavus]|nr:DUF4251 domain-containing protein [Cruoricaptor ignavus]
MKTFIYSIFVAVVFTLSACGSSQNFLDSKTVNTLVNDKEFTFMAQRAIPTNYDVLNVMNSIPNAPQSRLLNLDYGYTIVLKKDELVATLPYFGRMFTPTMNRDKEGYRFTSKDFLIQKSEGKKGRQILEIQPKDLNHIQKIVMEIYPNGKAYVTIAANDRQPISYDGYLMTNEAEK